MLWTVVMYPSRIPQFSSSTFTSGATLLVVQEALDRIEALRSINWSLTPNTTVGMVLSGDGAESSTCPAPAMRCCLAAASVRNLPVDSITASIPMDFQGRFSGDRSEYVR